MTGQLFIPRRFCGPPSSGNGGWTAGALAAQVPRTPDDPGGWPAIRVALRRPPPLETPLTVDVHEGMTVATDGADWTAVVASAKVSDADLAPVEPVPAEEARAAMATFPGLTSHPFPTCFVCGPDREPGDGLRIFPGQVGDIDGTTRVAATWTPDPSLREDPPGDGVTPGHGADVHHTSLATTWAALDCVGGWAGDLTERLMVLAGMTARVDALPIVGEEHVVMGAKLGSEGRKTFTASTLYDADGRVVAVAEHLWIEVDPSAFA